MASLIAAAAVVMIASVAAVAVGAAYKWQVTSKGYGVWTRVIGVVAILGLAGITLWSRRAEPVVALLIGFGGVALSTGYLWLHMRLTRNLREAGVDSSL